MNKKKVALMFICLNTPYWPFLKDVIEDCRKNFLTEHKVDFFTWSDMPEDVSYGATVFPTEPITWPYPTLMRYHLFLQQEEVLKEYDYIFYLDVDMRVVASVGDEILGDGLTMAEHPMYSIRREYVPPYEPNNQSSAFIPRLGVVINDNGKPWFKPLYAAGGFQGGTAKEFLKAMHAMKAGVDKDFNNNYVAIWNDESHWNKYLYGYEGHLTVLSPSYVYPDSLIEEYYVKVWGKNYTPKIVTLTKKFTTTKEGMDDLKKRLETM
jgi:histo-blood group ABO system transferase